MAPYRDVRKWFKSGNILRGVSDTTFVRAILHAGYRSRKVSFHAACKNSELEVWNVCCEMLCFADTHC